MPVSPRARSQSRTRGSGRFYESTAGGGSTPYENVILTDTPIAYYRMGDASGTTMTDSSGNGRNGSYVGTPTLGATGLLDGNSDKAVTLNGSTQYGSVTYGSWMDQATFTIEAVVKGTYSTTGANTIADRRSGTGFANQAWQFRVNAGILQLLIMNSSSVATYSGSRRLVNGITYSVAVTVSSTTVTFYVNGSQDASTSRTAAPNIVSSDLKIGASGSTPGEFFQGTLDEVSVYAGALNSTRVTAHGTAKGAYPSRINLVPNPNLETDATNYTGGSATLTRSTTWANTGAASLRVDPSGSNDSFASVAGDAAVNTLQLSMAPGRTYTVSGTVNTPVAQTGTLHASARCIRAQYHDGTYHEVNSTAGPTTGSARVSVSMTIPSNATQAFIRLYNGSSVTGQYVYWDDVLVEDAASLDTYFDGDTTSGGGVTYAWAGTSRASASTKT